MKLAKIGLTIVLSLMLLSVCPVVQANDDEPGVDLEVNIIALPIVTTEAATSIGTTTATLNGTLTDLGTASPVEVSFEWGTTDAYGSTATVTASPLSAAPSAFSATLTGLSASTSYHFIAKAVGDDGTGYGEDRTFTTTQATFLGGGGGGGGGGPILPPGTTDVRGMVGTAGVFYSSVTAYTEERACWLTIPAGTVGLTEELEPLTLINMLIMDDPPPPPEGAHIIGLPHEFQPSGATFDPPATLTCNYDPDNLPEGVAEEDLVLAYYDQEAGEWVTLECTVDTETNTITALISHFTAFSKLGYEEVPEAAAFTPSSLVISPTKVDIDQTVNVSLSVANTGGMAGSYRVTLKIDGEVEATQQVTVGAGASEEVTFTTAKDVAASYSVDVNGLSGSFTVKEEVTPAPPPPAPPEVKAPINWPLIGGLIAAAVIAGLLFFLIRRGTLTKYGFTRR